MLTVREVDGVTAAVGRGRRAFWTEVQLMAIHYGTWVNIRLSQKCDTAWTQRRLDLSEKGSKDFYVHACTPSTHQAQEPSRPGLLTTRSRGLLRKGGVSYHSIALRRGPPHAPPLGTADHHPRGTRPARGGGETGRQTCPDKPKGASPPKETNCDARAVSRAKVQPT